MIRIFLIGYMGTGKTTLGKAFARELGIPFVDLDWYIEERFHKTISQLFDERGEEAFRNIERKMLEEVAAFEDVIISTGGGTPCYFDNMDLMNACGQTVLLEASPQVLFSRLSVARNQRPSLQGKNDEQLKAIISSGLASRDKYYRKAQFVFGSNELESRRQVSQSVEKLRILLNLT